MRTSFRIGLVTSLLLAWFVVLMPLPASAITYYISNLGNDANSGTSPSQAWQTLDRLNQVQYSMQGGDQVLLKRGGTYRGTLPLNSSGTDASPIIIGAYGTGELPIVSGSNLVTSWVPYQGNIWRASVSGTVKQVYVNGQLMTLARYPNSGWLRMDQGTSTTLQDADLTQPDGYWNGATAVIRASNWNYDLATVSSFSNGSLDFPTIYDQPGNYQWGYFLCNKLSELDEPGEWYFDDQAGMLYLQAPNNTDPNTLQVEAAVRDDGAYVGWNRQHMQIQDLAFQHQTDAGVQIDGGHYITVTGCSFQNMYHAIRSYGSYNSYLNSTFHDILASGVLLIDDHSAFSGNHLENIGLVPGSGETTWGYMGIRTIGTDNTISDNVFNNIGYTGITIDHNAIVQRNVLQNCLVTLNDGGGIAFDNTDGAILQDNIITDISGNLESSAPDFPSCVHISFGIYFGNTSIKNTLVQHNTVTRCGSGIHVDHTMANTGNAIKDNVLFDNSIQLSISDLSNNSGPAAVAPYYVAQYNEEYSGNSLYSLKRDQLCMSQYNCHSTQPVDFGTFTNNRYFNPYNELSILLVNTYSGVSKSYALERWQTEHSEDVGSTSSPLQLDAYEVTDTIGDELMDNGTFNDNVTGWGGWPTNALVTHDYTYLDNGALKANLPDASVYPQFSMQNPVPFPVASGEWYRMSFSLQSDIQGQLQAAVKGLSQVTGLNTLGAMDYPFSTKRREVELIFQSDLTDQAMVQFTNTYQDPHYWLDNVSVRQVQVQALDPHDKQVLLYNDHGTEQTFPLIGCWSDLDGNYHNNSISLPGFRSIILVKEGDDQCDGIVSGAKEIADPHAEVAYPNPVQAGGWLHLSGSSTGTFRMWGMNGQLVFESQVTAGSSLIKVPESLQPGVYVASITDHGNARHFKLMVQ